MNFIPAALDTKRCQPIETYLYEALRQSDRYIPEVGRCAYHTGFENRVS